MNVTPRDRAVLRPLAQRVKEIAALPSQQTLRKAWMDLNGLRRTRPMTLVFPEGSWLELIPTASLQCTDPILRSWETRLRMAIYTHEELGDDQPIDAVVNVYYDAWTTGFGIEQHAEMTDSAQREVYYVHPYQSLSLTSHSALGAYHVEPALKEKSDLDKLQVPQLVVRRETSNEWLAAAQDIFGDILTVRRRGCFWNIIGGFPVTAIALRGMENLMMDMYDDPSWVRQLIDFLARAHHEQLDAIERENLLCLNNEGEWIGTGGIGYSDQLPPPGCDAAHIRCRDIWGGVQGQDLVGTSPQMFFDFFLPHCKAIMERFGMSTYGCCEPVHEWLAGLMTIRNLRRVSISPWADVARCAEQMKGNYVFSYKPLPSLVAGPTMDDGLIRQTLTQSLTATRDNGCCVEVIMKDLHTIYHQPQRLRRWVELVRSTIDEVYGA